MRVAFWATDLRRVLDAIDTVAADTGVAVVVGGSAGAGVLYASLGAGEASLGPTAAAIGNAVRDALGAQIHDLPLTAENLMRSL